MELWLFQGTFNPIHNAHLRVAEYIAENFGANKIIFIPAYIPPHKDSQTSLAEHRLKMTELAVKDNPYFNVSDIEFQLGGKSYTYRTICELRKRYNLDEKINFIIGTDAFKNIEKWYEADKLKKLVKFRVFPRDKEVNKQDYEYLREKGYDFEFVPLEFEDISSTELREAVKLNKNLDRYVPKIIEDYIKENGLYKD